MTREEAIEILKNDDEIFNDCWNEAIDMAIQALSQEQDMTIAYLMGKYEDKEPCDDAISRKDAEQMFRNIRSHLKPQDYKSAEEFNTRDLMLLNAEQMIHALPSVKATGK